MTQRIVLRPLAGLAVLAAALGCSQEPTTITAPTEGQSFTRTVESGGQTRSYQAWVPLTVRSDRPAPIIISLHPDPGTGSDMRGITGFDQIARLLETIMVYPDATSDWAEECNCTAADGQGVDDVQFIRDLIDDLDSTWPVDRSKIYVAGFGQGGAMAQTLACRMNEVAAVGVVAATLSVSLSQGCDPARPVPTALIHGTLDPLYPAGGRAAGDRQLLSIRETLAFWLDGSGCAADPSETSVQDLVDDGTTVNVELYHGCASGSEVEFYEVVNGGNTWPNPTINFPASSGLKTEDIDGAAVLGVFFLRH